MVRQNMCCLGKSTRDWLGPSFCGEPHKEKNSKIRQARWLAGGHWKAVIFMVLEKHFFTFYYISWQWPDWVLAEFTFLIFSLQDLATYLYSSYLPLLPKARKSLHFPAKAPCSCSPFFFPAKEWWRQVFSRACCDTIKNHDFILKEGRFSLNIRFKFFIMSIAETLEKIVQRDGRCPVPGNIQSLAGWGSEQTFVWRFPCQFQGGVGFNDF